MSGKWTKGPWLTWRDYLSALAIALALGSAGCFWATGRWWMVVVNGGLIGFVAIRWMDARAANRRVEVARDDNEGGA